TGVGGLLPDVVNGVKGELAKQAQRTLTTINNPVLAEIANKLDNRLFVTAGIAQTLLTQPEDKWDETAKHTFQLLRGNFPEYFADPKETEQSLAFLAGRDALLEVIGSVHQQKEAILAKQVNDFMAAQRSSVTEAQNALLDHFEQKKALIQDTDLADTEQALHSIVSVEATGASAANIMFKDHVDELSQGVSVELKKHIKQFSKEVRGDVKASESSESETYQRAKDGFWAGVGRFLGAGGYEESTRTVTTFQAHEARTALEDLSFFIEHGLNDAVQAKLLYWRRKLAQDLTAKLRECIGDSHVNADQLAAVCRLAIAEVKDLPAAKIPELPAELAKGGKLKGREAEEYLDEATRYISTLTRAANAYVKDVSNDIAQLAGFNIGHRLFSHLRDEAEQLQSLLKNKRLTIDKLGSLTQQLREL
ncbi:MAG: hypothetical protein M1356_08670, partial [Gammaproteobacteria bacterium]|nr:hypothetical protein [Gammaproteobacteria bacterium]